MLTETQDIQRAYCVTRACGPTVRATAYGSGSKLRPAKRHFRCCTLVTAIMPLML